jgi:uncharacterized protein (TIGR02246 family)
MSTHQTPRDVLVLTPFLIAAAAFGLCSLTAIERTYAQSASAPQSPRDSQQPPAAASQPATAGANQPVQSEQYAAIRAFDAGYVREFNIGDCKALAARFTEDAEVVEADGSRYEGRNLIEERLRDSLTASPGARMELQIESIRLLSPDAAKEEGRTVVTPTKGAPVARRYLVLLVRRADRWLISSIHEEPDPQVPPHERLKELEWMLGEWVDEGPDSHVRVSCRWSEDENFLLRSFAVKMQGRPAMTVSQRIGWDPVAQQIRSWEFDSQGGFGEGRWGRDGERWVIKYTAVRAEGTTVSATNTMTHVRPDLVRWTSTDRVFGAEAVPDAQAYVLVRVPPAPGTHSDSPPTSPSGTQKRSPR